MIFRICAKNSIQSCIFLQNSDSPLEGFPSSALRPLNFPSIRDHQVSAKAKPNPVERRLSLTPPLLIIFFHKLCIWWTNTIEIPSWFCKVTSMCSRGMRKTNSFNVKRDSYYQAYNVQISWSSKVSNKSKFFTYQHLLIGKNTCHCRTIIF